MASKGSKGTKGAAKAPSVKKIKQIAQNGALKLPKIPEGVSYVSYREQLLGAPCPSQPHRRMRRWWMKDQTGKETSAVETVGWDNEQKRFEYTASEEFSKMLEVTCYSHKSVYEYLDLFLHPEKYKHLETNESSMPSEENVPNDPKKRKRSSTGDSKGTTKGENDKESNPKKKSVGLKKEGKKGVPKKPEDLLKNVSKELSILQGTYGMRYSLTIIGPHGDVKVLSSPTVEKLDIEPHEIEGFAYPQNLNMLSDAAHGVGQDAVTIDIQDECKEDDYEIAVQPDHEKASEMNESDQIVSAQNTAQVIDADEEIDPVIPPMRSTLQTGLEALVKFVQNTEETLYLPGSFWRRDPFPSILIQSQNDGLRPASDAGQQHDIDRISAFLKVEKPAKQTKNNGKILVVDQNIPTQDPSHFLTVPVWGIDTYTRSLFDCAIASCESAILSREKRNHFFDKFFLPRLNMLGNDGWDTFKALETIHGDEEIPEDFRKAAKGAWEILDRLEDTAGTGKDVTRYQPLRPSGRRYCRSHPKGDGVILRKDGGLIKNVFVGEYSGALYAPWRFFEKDCSKGFRGNTKSQSILHTCTATFERPNMDQMGSSILFIDGSQSGNFVSRINHSCNPNCSIRPFVVDQHLKLGVWTEREITNGEELTIDFGRKGDFERELQGLTCLCGSEHCKNTFVNLGSASSPVNAVVSEKYGILPRTKIILDSANSGLTRNDLSRLDRHGFRQLILQDGVDSPGIYPLPEWLKWWTSQTLKYIEEESIELRTILHNSEKHPRDIGYSEDDIKRVASSRAKSLIVALDRIRFFLSNQAEQISRKPPLVILDEDNIVQFLWSSSSSVAHKAVKCLEAYVDGLASAAIGSKRSSRQGSDQQPKAPWWQVSSSDPHSEKEEKPSEVPEEIRFLSHDEVLAKMKALMRSEKPRTRADAQEALKKLASIAIEGGPLHAGLHDLVIIYSYTNNFFSQTEFKPFKPYMIDGSIGGRQRSSVVWGTLSGWYKNNGDVIDNLCTERRGALCLPDVESCYLPAFTNGEYIRTDERSSLISYLEGDISSPWPRNLTSFTFRTTTKYFGSPQFDCIMDGLDDRTPSRLKDIAEHLRGAFPHVSLKN